MRQTLYSWVRIWLKKPEVDGSKQHFNHNVIISLLWQKQNAIIGDKCIKLMSTTLKLFFIIELLKIGSVIYEGETGRWGMGSIARIFITKSMKNHTKENIPLETRCIDAYLFIYWRISLKDMERSTKWQSYINKYIATEI